MYKLSPSDFKYLWEECKHCYYQKVHIGVVQPSIGIPSIFSRMSSLLQKNLQSQNPKDLHPALPSGQFVLTEGYLKSQPLPSKKSYINGRFDLLAKLDDGTYGVIDVKMTDARDESLDKFDRQLHAYKYALENPQTEDPISISRAGLLIVAPTDIRPHQGNFYYKAKPVWKEIPLNMEKFFEFIDEVESLLNDSVPAPSVSCDWCKYKYSL